MEPEDTTRRVSQNIKMTKMPSSSFSLQSSDNLRSVQEIQTDRRRRKRGSRMEQEHECSSSSSSTMFGRRMCPSSTLSFSSSSSLVFFLLTSTLLLLVCVVPSQSLPFEGRSLLSSSSNIGGGAGSNSHRSQMDLLIDPIHQAEYGDEDPSENTRVVKSVFDMVLRTPPPPTRSTNNCPPGTQSPFEGGPCIKKNTDPVATVDQSFLLDTLRDLTKEGIIFQQRTRRPGGNRRRPSGRRTTTTVAPSTTMNSSEEELEGEISPTTTDSENNAGDNTNLNVVAVVEEQVVVTEDPTTTSSGTTTLAAAPSDAINGETEKPQESDGLLSSSSSSVEQIGSDTIAPAEATTETVATTIAPTTSAAASTEVSPVKDGVDLRRTAEAQQQAETVPSSAATGNDEQKVVMNAVAATAPTTLIETLATTTTSTLVSTTATTEQQQQVKSGQVQKEEPVPTITMMTTTTSQLDQSSANNSSSSDVGGSIRPSSPADHVVEQISNQGDSQISPESQINNQDDHRGSYPQHPVSLPSPTLSSSLPPPSSVIATAPTPTQPTFLKEEILTTVDDVTYQEAQADKNHDHVVSPIGTTVTTNTNPTFITATANLSSSEYHPMRTFTTVKSPKLIETVATENQTVTGVTLQHALEQQQETLQPDAQFQINNVSLANSSEMQVEAEAAQKAKKQQENENLLKTILMITRMMKAGTSETPQIGQDDNDGSTVSVTLSPVMSSSFADLEMMQQEQPKKIPASSAEQELPSSPLTTAFERESIAQTNDQDVFTATLISLLSKEEEESNTKVMPDTIPTGEGTSATTMLDNNEKVLRPLGPLEKTAGGGSDDETTTELQEQQQQRQVQQDAAVEEEIAGDISSVTTKDEQQIEQGTEAGDSQISSGNDDDAVVVNHSNKEDSEVDKVKEMVTHQVENADLAIMMTNNDNLPASVSPVHDDSREQREPNEMMPTTDADDIINVPENKDGGDEKSSFEVERELTGLVEHEQTGNILPEKGTPSEETIFNKNKDGPASSLETALVPPAATTNAPPITGSYPVHKFQPSDTLLQFQLPIVTRVPSVPARQHDNVRDASDSFQPFNSFPEFSSGTNPGKVRFPNSAEEDGDEDNQSHANLKPPAPFKSFFVEDFHLDYPPRHGEASPPHPQQKWQVPKPFTSLESKDTPPHLQQQTLPPALAEYYDTGSTEYLESELDRHHQKTRSRNRIRNSPEANNIPSTTNQPLLPPELSFYTASQQPSPTSQQQPHHHQHSLYSSITRKSPSFEYLNSRTGHDRFRHNHRRLVW